MLNSFSGIGRLGSDPQVHKNGESTRTTFDIAINEFYRQGDDLKKKTHWIPCVSYGRLAEIAGEFLTKGSQIGIRGPIKLQECTGEKGSKQRKLLVHITEFEFLSSRADVETDTETVTSSESQTQ